MNVMKILQRKKYKILLIGDSCNDFYHYGSVTRISPEAPIPILKTISTKMIKGMASNVYKNLISLKADVDFFHGKESTKTRFIENKSRYQLLRVDDDEKSDPIDLSILESKKYDAIVISDYNKGFIPQDITIKLKEKYKDIPIFIDTKKTDLTFFDGCFIKINELEYDDSINKDVHEDCLIVTLGSKGTRYKDKVYSTEKVEVHDVTGAGDVFLSSLCIFYLLTGSIENAIPFANKLATVSVQHEGNYTVQKEDLIKL